LINPRRPGRVILLHERRVALTRHRATGRTNRGSTLAPYESECRP
jgi:hypothetical protein